MVGTLRSKLYGLLFTLGYNRPPNHRIRTSHPTQGELIASNEASIRRINLAHGLSPYTIDGITVWAINFKKAQLKAKAEALKLIANTK